MTPPPPTDLSSRTARLITLERGVILHRFYTKPFEPIFFDTRPTGRFNAPDASFGALYAAEHPDGGFVETFLRTPGRRMVDMALVQSKGYVQLEVGRPLTLAHMDGPGLAILGATATVTHGDVPYDVAQDWAKALYDHPARYDGIAYSSRHDPFETCYAIFNRAEDAITETARLSDLDIDWFWLIAEKYNAARPS